jgi:Asp-tRNA(Asn)/Glu-tRNA(Gln) amidotransferase C subunit
MEEQQKEAIRKQAEKILDKFGKSLESVKLKEKKTDNKVGGFRKEGKGIITNPEFRKRMFANAPDKNDDFIIAEKKSW